MKRPLADQQTRRIMIEQPGCAISQLCQLSMEMRKCAREFTGIFVPLIGKIVPYIGMEVKPQYKRYLN